MTSRTLLLLWLVVAKGSIFVLEQPQGSILDAHPRFVDFIDRNVVWEVSIKMEWFNGDTPKPMVLYTNAKWLEDLALVQGWCPKKRGGLAVMVEDKVTGKRRPTGSVALEGSQAYTAEFGRAVAALFAKHRKAWRVVSLGARCKKCGCAAECPTAVDLLSKPAVGEDAWADADVAQAVIEAQQAALQVCPASIVESVGSDTECP